MNLKLLTEQHGKCQLARMHGGTCTRWIWSHQANEFQKITYNLRGLFADEILLDIENKEDAPSIIKGLKAMGLNFTVWDTGSKGIHIHLFFPEMIGWPAEKIKLAREWFIKKFGTDIMKKSGLVAREGMLHFKTGQPKKLIRVVNSGN